MSETNKALARRWFEEVWNQKRAGAIDELFTPDTLAHGLAEDGGPLVGTEGFKAFHAAFTGAFPDLRVEVEDVIAEGDKTAIRFSGSGTHTGSALGMPPTNRTVRFTGMTFTRWVDGRIAEGWNNVDIASIFRQIGEGAGGAGARGEGGECASE